MKRALSTIKPGRASRAKEGTTEDEPNATGTAAVHVTRGSASLAHDRAGLIYPKTGFSPKGRAIVLQTLVDASRGDEDAVFAL